MNRRRISLMLALLLALSAACIAEEEVPAEAPAAEQQSEPEAKPAKEEKAEAAPKKEARAEAAPAKEAAAEVEAAPANEAAEVEAEKVSADPAPAEVEANDAEVNDAEEAFPSAESEEAGAGGDSEGSSDGAQGEGDSDPDAGADGGDSSGEGEGDPDSGAETDPGEGGEDGGDPDPDNPDPDDPDPDVPDPDNPDPDDPGPDVPAGELTISVEGATRAEDGEAWVIPYSAPEDEIHFTWTAVEGADEYSWRIADASGGEVASGTQAEASLTQIARDYLSGRFTLTVEAQISAAQPEGSEASGEAQTLAASYIFELKLEEQPDREPDREENPSGGFGGFGGGRPSGSGSFGGGSASAAGGAAAGQGEQGVQVTPGEALTDDHASGSKDMTAYGTVALRISKSTQTQLTLGGAELGVALADGGSFKAKLSGGELILSAEDDSEWRVNGLALEVLAHSGVDELELRCGDATAALPTDLTFQGPVYAACRARGCVAKDFELIVTASGVAVLADGERCALADDGTLVRE